MCAECEEAKRNGQLYKISQVEDAAMMAAIRVGASLNDTKFIAAMVDLVRVLEERPDWTAPNRHPEPSADIVTGIAEIMARLMPPTAITFPAIPGCLAALRAVLAASKTFRTVFAEEEGKLTDDQKIVPPSDKDALHGMGIKFDE